MKESWEIHWEDYYKLLEVSGDADDETIKKAYLYKVWLLGRVEGAPKHVQFRAGEELKKVNNAYDTLKNPVKHKEYHEEWLRRNVHSGNSNDGPKANPHNDPPKPPPKSDPPPYANKPKPVVTPDYIRADNVEPNKVFTGAFTIENAGGAYSKLSFSRPNSWLKVVRWSSLSTSDELPMKVEIECIATDWGKTYNETITVNLDQEVATVGVVLVTKPVPDNPRDNPVDKEKRRTSRSRARMFTGIFAVALIAVVGIIALYNRKPALNTNNYGQSQTAARVTTTPFSQRMTALYTTTSVFTTPITTTPTHLASPIQYGQSVTGQIAFGNDFQDWKFSGQAGDVITIDMVQDGGASLMPNCELFDPSGVQITSSKNTDTESWVKNYTLKLSGIYTIHAVGTKGYDYKPTIGGYKLNVTKKAPAATIVYGQAVTGQITFADDYQDWKFSGQAGDVITIDMVQDGGASLMPNCELFDPSGVQITSGKNTDTESWVKNYPLKFPGIYTIHAVGTEGYDYKPTIGGYKLNVTKKAPAATIVYGQAVTGQIIFADDYQDWKFSGQAGDVITIDMVQDGGASLMPNCELFDPSGVQITSGKNTDTESWVKNYTLKLSGIYTIHAFGTKGYDYKPTIGGYKLNVTKKAPAATIVYGQAVTGQITFTDDYQDWKFSGQAGDVITIDMVQDGGASLMPNCELFDPSGVQITSGKNTDAESWVKNYPLKFPGIYTIHAVGTEGYDYKPTIGGYKLTLTKN